METPHLDLDPELTYTFSRSGGKGGQHVNKVSTKASLRFDLLASQILSDEQKALLQEKLSNHINQEGILYLNADDTRSQLKNKEIVRSRFYALLQKAFLRPKKRKKTKIPKAVKERRLKNKRMKSLKKQNRKSGGWE